MHNPMDSIGLHQTIPRRHIQITWKLPGRVYGQKHCVACAPHILGESIPMSLGSTTNVALTRRVGIKTTEALPVTNGPSPLPQPELGSPRGAPAVRFRSSKPASHRNCRPLHIQLHRTHPPSRRHSCFQCPVAGPLYLLYLSHHDTTH